MSSQTSKLSAFISVLDKLQKLYDQSLVMSLRTYDEKVVEEAMSIVKEQYDFSDYQKKEMMIVMYNILSTDAGYQFLKSHKGFCVDAVSKAKEIMMRIAESVEVVDIELARVIAIFTITNGSIFHEHGISPCLYFGDDE